MESLEQQTRRFHRSVEFFPPKTEKAAAAFGAAAAAVKAWQPDWVSLTYGAGGKSRESTFEWSRWLVGEMKFQVLQHLTCIGHSQEELDRMLSNLDDEGYAGIMALRGDIPRGETSAFKDKGAFKYASELVEYIRAQHQNLYVGVAGYPEKHPESTSLDADIINLKRKVDAGGSFIVTQLFFDNESFYKFVDKARKAGIEVPIYPGLLPPVDLDKLKKFCALCEASIPKKLEDELTRAMDLGGPAACVERGVEWTLEQVQELLAQGAPGYHLYLLNRRDVFTRLLPGLP